jgi:hypothetical protein
MTINSRVKGQVGEREVVHKLNAIIEQVLGAYDWHEDVVNAARKCIQRNQNQSAVGGSDLNGVFGLAVEIKRQENVQIEKWWEQCTEQAARNAEHPVLLYRKNHQPWRCVTLGHAPLPGGRISSMRVQFEEDAFSTWFYQWVYYKMVSGELPRI